MRPTTLGAILTTALLWVVMSAPAAAGIGAPSGRASELLAGRSQQAAVRTGETSTGVVRGYVLDASDRPVPNVAVRLRDMANGRILDLRRTDTNGAFQFEQVPPGRYVTEALDNEGRVIGIGQSFPMSGDSPVETTVRLRSKVKGAALFFSNAAPAIIAAAAAIGFAAWAQTGQPVSPQR